MRFKNQRFVSTQGDLTPMIDMTFQLIAFLMVLVNFTEAEQDERIKLPASELVKPPDAPLESPIFLHLTDDRTVLVGGQEVPIPGVEKLMAVEARVLELKGKSPADATVIIRADANAPTGEVQQLVQICQGQQFENFALRAEEKIE
jgi:biopolymer transport protein ExbD